MCAYIYIHTKRTLLLVFLELQENWNRAGFKSDSIATLSLPLRNARVTPMNSLCDNEPVYSIMHVWVVPFLERFRVHFHE